MQERAEKFAPAAALALYLVLLGTVLVLAGVGGGSTVCCRTAAPPTMPAAPA